MAAPEIDGLQSDRVKVAVRLRPASLNEKIGNYKAMVKVTGENVLCFDPDSTEDGILIEQTSGDADRRRRVGVRRAKNLRFAYDHVFDADCGTECIFEKTTRPLVDYVCSGYAATVFAYGATGSGKTHTMLGSAASGPGVMPLAIEALFEAMSKQDEEHTFTLRLSYLEVYNECIRDLLAPAAEAAAPSAAAGGGGMDEGATARRAMPLKRKDHGLALRHDARKGVSVVGLSEHEPTHASEVFEMLERGNARRAVSETAANAQSSRSHAVLQISLRRASRAAGVSDAHQLGKLTLVDLAGSERGSVSRNRGQTLHEGANINRSLLALGNCINALSTGGASVGSKSRFTHVPYRDSKLTRLLQYSLSGDTKTVMIATVSPAPSCTEDTHNTLKYAHRAKAIKVQATSKTVSVEYHVSRYQSIIATLQGEVAHWKAKALGGLGGGLPRSPAAVAGAGSADGVPPPPPPPAASSFGGDAASGGGGGEGADLFAAIDGLFSRRTSARQQLHELERADPAPPRKAEVRRDLEASLLAADAEEEQLSSAIGLVGHSERRAVLMQEVRCRQLLLENATLRLRLEALGGGGAEEGLGASLHAKACPAPTKTPFVKRAASMSTGNGAGGEAMEGEGEGEGEGKGEGGAAARLASPAGPLTAAGWRSHSRASSGGMGVGWLFVGGGESSKAGEGGMRPSLMVSQTPLVTRVVGSAPTVAKPTAAEPTKPTARPSMAPPPPPLPKALPPAKEGGKEAAAAARAATRRSIEELREIISENLPPAAAATGVSGATAAAGAISAGNQSPSKPQPAGGSSGAVARAESGLPAAAPSPSVASPTPATTSSAGGQPSTSALAPAPAVPPAAGTPSGKPKRFGARAKNALADLLGGLAAKPAGQAKGAATEPPTAAASAPPRTNGPAPPSEPPSEESRAPSAAAGAQESDPPSAPPPPPGAPPGGASSPAAALTKVRLAAEARAAAAEELAAAKVAEARRASTLLMSVVSVVSPSKLPPPPSRFSSLSGSPSVRATPEGAGAPPAPPLGQAVALGQGSTLDLDLGDATPELSSAPVTPAEARQARRPVPLAAVEAGAPGLAVQVSLDARLAMEAEEEAAVQSPALGAARPTTAPPVTSAASGAVAGGALSARSAGASNSSTPLNRRSAVAASDLGTGSPKAGVVPLTLATDKQQAVHAPQEDVENGGQPQGKARWNAASAVTKAPRQAWGVVAAGAAKAMGGSRNHVANVAPQI